MGKFRQFLTELFFCDKIMVGYYIVLTFLLSNHPDHESCSVFVLMISRSSSKLSQLGSKFRSPGQIKPTSMAQSDGLTGVQEVVGSIPARSGNILSWRLSLIITVILSFPLIPEGHLSVSGERMCSSTG